MDNRAEVRAFLMTRRAHVRPDEVGLVSSGRRRVAGLRRGEVAVLADVSPEYYARIERGQLAGVSDAVLGAIATALRLDDAEREYLFHLARAAGAPRTRVARPTREWTPRESLLRVLDAVTDGPAFVRNGRLDILATNALGAAFYDEVIDGPGRGNLARFCFLDDRARAFYPEWAAAAAVTVAILRTEAGRDPHDKALHDLVGELSTRSEPFRVAWADHDVRRHGSGTKRFVHHEVGEVTLTYEGLELTAEPGLSLLIYTAAPGSPSHERLRLLASWAASGPVDPADPAPTRHPVHVRGTAGTRPDGGPPQEGHA